MTHTFYTTRDEAIAREIVEPIEASGEVSDAYAEYDVEGIARAALDSNACGWVCVVDSDEFWGLVEKHAR